MKKALSFLLAVILILGLSTTAFAEEITENQGTAQSAVMGTYQAGTEGGTVFSVEIEWSGLEFTYNAESNPIWNSEELKYSGVATPEGWAESNGTITVKNSSNTIIVATPSYEAATGYTDVGMSFDREKLYVHSAEPVGDATTGTVQTGTISVTPTGKLPAGTKDATIGTITVTIAEFGDISQNDVNDYLCYWEEKYVPANQMEPGQENLIVACFRQEHVDAVEEGRKYVILSEDEYELFVGITVAQAASGFYGEITQAELNKLYIDTITFEQSVNIQVKQ